MYLKPDLAQLDPIIQDFHFKIDRFSIVGIVGIEQHAAVVTDRCMKYFDMNQTTIIDMLN
jgi:hypothetical protein